MNHAYRLIRTEVKASYAVVAKFARSRDKGYWGRGLLSLLMAAFLGMLPLTAHAL